MPDAEAVLSFFKKAEKQCGSEVVTSAIEKILDRQTLTSTTKELPDSAGVYFFYGPDQELLYIGKSKHVRTRVRSHFHANPIGKEKRIQGETALIETVQTSGELSALLLEANLIKEESPIYNKALRNRKRLVVAKEKINDQGYAMISLEWIADLTPDTSVLSVYRNMTQAKQKLRELIIEYKLCSKLTGLDPATKSCFNYQLRKCDGACIGKPTTEEYNERLKTAFARRRLKNWPYKGPVLIKEEGTEETGTIFIVDNWILKHAYTYEGGSYDPFLKQGSSFDYDTYKILSRFIIDTKNKKSIRVLTQSEYKQHLSSFTDTHEDIVYV